MQTPLQLTFRGIAPSEPIETYVRTGAGKLERFCDRITGCHVMIESPHRHKRHGHHYRIRIDLVVPGDELVVKRDPAEGKEREDLYASVDPPSMTNSVLDHAFERPTIGTRVRFVEETGEQGPQASTVAITG
jgi:hypothetical protein